VAEFRWTTKGIVAEGESFTLDGENVWLQKWVAAEYDPIQLPHPDYPAQTHRFSVYRIDRPIGEIRFAAAEVSPNVWAFYA